MLKRGKPSGPELGKEMGDRASMWVSMSVQKMGPLLGMLWDKR